MANLKYVIAEGHPDTESILAIDIEVADAAHAAHIRRHIIATSKPANLFIRSAALPTFSIHGLAKECVQTALQATLRRKGD